MKAKLRHLGVIHSVDLLNTLVALKGQFKALDTLIFFGKTPGSKSGIFSSMVSSRNGFMVLFLIV